MPDYHETNMLTIDDLVFEGVAQHPHGLPEGWWTEMCSGSEAGSYVRLIDLCITQL